MSKLGSKKNGMEIRAFPTAGRTRCGVLLNFPFDLRERERRREGRREGEREKGRRDQRGQACLEGKLG